MAKAARKFEDVPANLVIWKYVQLCKERSDDCCEAYSMLLEAVIEAAEKELDAHKDSGAPTPLLARLETMQGELVNFEHKKEQIDDKFFQLAAGVETCEDSVVVADVKVDSGKVKPASQASLGVQL